MTLPFDFQNYHHFIGLMAIIFLLKLKDYILTTKNRFLIFCFYFGVVFLHELSHYLMSKLTCGKPTQVSLIPKLENDSWILGFVMTSNLNAFNAFLISFAPTIILMPLAFFLWINWSIFFDFSLLNEVLKYLIVGTILNASLPSIQDMKISFVKGSSIIWISIITLTLFTLYSPKGLEGLQIIENNF